MTTDLNRKLQEAEQGALHLKKIDAMLESLRADRLELERKMFRLEGELESEQLDVEKLENSNILGMFYTVLGKYGERLEKEKAEALAAKMKYDQAVSEFEAAEAEIGRLRSERKQYRDCPGIYRSLYAQKEQILKDSGGKSAEEIMELQSKLNYEKNKLKEIKEAINAGRSAKAYLDKASEYLSSASDIGVWDMLGGGLIADLSKHSRIDDAKEAAETAQRKLWTFRTELADIDISEDIRFETGGFAKFADFFFDGLIADWSMQSRISNSRSSINTAAGKVYNVLRRLESMERETESQISVINYAIKKLIVES